MLSVGILIFDEVEVLDFSGPYEVFSTATRVVRRTGKPAPFRCFLVAGDLRPIRARGGMKVLPDCVLPPATDLDVLVVAGGDVALPMQDARLRAWIAARASDTLLVASVCTGAFLLARAGLLDSLPATTHKEDLDELQRSFPAVAVRADTPWIDCGKVATSGGISAGIDMSLHLVERLAGRELAQATARQMEYRWNTHGTNEQDRSADAGVFLAA